MAQSYSLVEIATLINATIVGDDSRMISNVASLQSATDHELSFLVSRAYLSQLKETNAGAVIISENYLSDCPSTALVVDHPEFAFATVAALFDGFEKNETGIHPSAIIHETAEISPDAYIGPRCVIGKNVVVKSRAYLSATICVGNNSTIDEDTLVHPNVTIMHHCHIGKRVILHPGVVIGADGFGLTRTTTGWKKIPQIGGVILKDDVEVGANTCIDRGALTNTMIHEGVKIDNLVQIAHNVEVGEHTVIAGCTGIAGSTLIGKNCMIAGAVNIAGHLIICDNVVITGNAMVTKSIQAPGIYSSGTGLYPNSQWRKMAVRLRQLDHFMKRKEKT